jgi:hypothetical protein
MSLFLFNTQIKEKRIISKLNSILRKILRQRFRPKLKILLLLTHIGLNHKYASALITKILLFCLVCCVVLCM